MADAYHAIRIIVLSSGRAPHYKNSIWQPTCHAEAWQLLSFYLDWQAGDHEIDFGGVAGEQLVGSIT
jgi:hypothetical protein